MTPDAYLVKETLVCNRKWTVLRQVSEAGSPDMGTSPECISGHPEALRRR